MTMVRGTSRGGTHSARLRRIGSRLQSGTRVTDTAAVASDEATAVGPPGQGVDWVRRVELAGVLVAMIVGIVSIWHTERSVNQVQEELSISREELRATREGQITDRYTAAVENLGDDSLDVRLGGIYALKRIMQDSPRDQGTVVDVLAAYVRAHAVPPKSGQKSPEYLDRDVAAAVTVLATRDQSHDPQSQLYDGLYLIDLSGTWLKGLVLRKADLRGVYLRNSNLSGSELHDVDLGGATLIGSNMRNVNFFKVNLEDAVMDGADLQNAKLTANLQAAALRGANLRHAYLESAMHTRCKPGQGRPARHANVHDNVHIRGTLHSGCLAGWGRPPRVEHQRKETSQRSFQPHDSAAGFAGEPPENQAEIGPVARATTRVEQVGVGRLAGLTAFDARQPAPWPAACADSDSTSRSSAPSVAAPPCP